MSAIVEDLDGPRRQKFVESQRRIEELRKGDPGTRQTGEGRVVAAASVAISAWGDIVVDQQGSTNSAVNGFTNDVGGPVYGSPVGGVAWNIQGPWCCEYDFDTLTGSQISDLNTSANWELNATYQNLVEEPKRYRYYR